MKNLSKNDDSSEKKILLTYKEIQLLKFIEEHPAINVLKVEKDCNLPKSTLRHFINDRRNLPSKYFEKLEEYLSNYGYVSLDE